MFVVYFWPSRVEMSCSFSCLTSCLFSSMVLLGLASLLRDSGLHSLDLFVLHGFEVTRCEVWQQFIKIVRVRTECVVYDLLQLVNSRNFGN